MLQINLYTMIHHSPLQWLCCRPDVFLLEHTVFHLGLALVWFWCILCEQLYQLLRPVDCEEEGSLALVSQPAGREQLLLARSHTRLGTGTVGAGGWRRKAAAWLPQGCLLTKGWQCLGGTGACLLSLVSYKGRTWKPRCLHWTSRIQGRMRPKWIPATLTSLHDTFPPLD